MELREYATALTKRWRLIVIGVAIVAVSSYLDTRATLHAHPAHTTLLAAAMGLVLASSTRRTLDLTALGSIPCTEGEDLPSKLVVVKSPHSPTAEAYYALHASLQSNAAGYPLKTLLVTSSIPLEGKSVIAANLAAVMAQSGQHVILVDADLRHPIQHRVFELDNRIGLSDALREDINLAEALQSVPVENLRVLTSGPLPNDPYGLLDHKYVREVIESLRQQADAVIIDSLPIAVLEYAKTLAVRLGGTLLIIDSISTYRSFVKHSKGTLDKAKPHLSGTTSDRLPTSSEDYYYYRYYSEHTSSTSPAEGVDYDQALGTGRVAQPTTLDLLRARVAPVVRRAGARNNLSVLLLGVVALIILAAVFVLSLVRQPTVRIDDEANRVTAMARTTEAETTPANQTATAIAKEKDATRRQTEVAQTQVAVSSIAGATATLQVINIETRQAMGFPACETIEFDILQSPNETQSTTAPTVNVELTWRVRNRAMSLDCQWGQAGQETRLLRALEVSVLRGIDVPVRLRWIQGDEYDLSLDVPLNVGEYALIWRLIPPATRLPRGPDLLARVVVVAPTSPSSPTSRPAPTACPTETYNCNCTTECNPRGGCQKTCDTCTRPKCD
jgi:capsular exopolysaccharide synthesis family protein